MTINQALIMAAGYATRMRPLTDNLPKPLLQINNKPMLTHIIDHLIAEGVTHIIINGYHAITHLRDYINDVRVEYPKCKFTLSEETQLLETGGGAVFAQQFLNTNEPFYMVNGDAYWVNDANIKTLTQLSSQWNEEKHDILLLLQSCQSMALTGAIGDYNIQNQMATRSINKNGTHMFTGVRICTPNIFNNHTVEKFSFLKLMDEAQKHNKLGAIDHAGDWYHISTPNDLKNVNEKLFGDVV